MDIHNIEQVPAITTKDGSELRELLAYRNSCIQRQSLAEARLPPDCATTPHRHPDTEEIYYILEGCGEIQIDSEKAGVRPGDAISLLLCPRIRRCRHDPAGAESPWRRGLVLVADERF